MSKKVLETLGKNLNRDMIEDLLENGFYKKNFNFLIKHMLEDVKPTSWRTAWIVNHLIEKDDKIIKKKLSTIIKSIKDKTEGHQRELIKIVRKMKLNEENEGLFFDVCMEIWRKVNKQPAVRYYCGLYIIEMARKYPEIKNELEYLTTDYYIKTLSPGIKKIFEKELEKVN